jgi:PAS domain-containing protein
MLERAGMPQKAVEIILMRQLASYLAMPIMLFDPAGNLIFYNEPAEAILGRRFDETGEMSLEEWFSIVELTAEDGSPLPFEARALVIALQKRQAAHRTSWLHKPDGSRRKIEATAFPLEGQGGRHLGAVAILWEAGQS